MAVVGTCQNFIQYSLVRLSLGFTCKTSFFYINAIIDARKLRLQKKNKKQRQNQKIANIFRLLHHRISNEPLIMQNVTWSMM